MDNQKITKIIKDVENVVIKTYEEIFENPVSTITFEVPMVIDVVRINGTIKTWDETEVE